MPVANTKALTLTDLLFEKVDAGLCLVAPDGTVIRANAEWLRSTGYTEEQAVGENIIDLLPETRDMALALHARVRAGHRVEVPRHARVVSGRETWWEGSIEPVLMEGGTGLLITARETTPELEGARAVSEQAEQLRRENEARLREYADLLEHAPVLVRSPDDRITVWNEGAEKLYGWRRDEAAGQVSHDLLRTTFPEPLTEIRAKLELTGRWEGELRHRHRDGSELIIASLWVLHRDGDGKAHAIVEVNSDITDRRRAEDDNENRLRVALDSAALGTFDLNLETGKAVWDEQQRRIWGVPPDQEMDYETIVARVHPDDRKRITDTFAKSLDPDSDGAYHGEYRLFRPDGSVRWCATSGRVYFRGDGRARRAVRVIGVEADITDRKHAEEALRRSEERLRLAQEVARVGTFEWDIPSGVNTWTPELEALYGLRPGGFGRTEAAFEQMIHPGDREQVLRWVEHAFETGAPAEGEWRVIWPDGSVHWIAGRWQVIKDASGTPVRMTGINMDVTRRKAAELARRAREAELELILGRTPFMLARVSRDLHYRYVSAAYARVAGRTPQELAGRPMVEVLGEEGLATIRPYVEAVLHGETVEYEQEVPFVAVGPRRLQAMYVPDRDERGEVVGWIANIVDVTEGRQAEALRAANAQLVEADQRRTQFLGMLSHELRNPLAPIRNSLYLLDRSEPTGQEAHRAREVINRQVGHLTRLVDDLLDVTRITRGKIELRRAELDLSALVRRTADDYRRMMQDRGLELAVEAGAAAIIVDGDETRLAQVFGNLLSNAAKFTPAGGRVTITAHAEGGNAVVRVRDSGPGIAPDVLPSIFEPFTQAKQTLARTEGGLGLGLALVRGLVSLHGGEVEAVSGSGGADFIVRLPLAAERRRQAALSAGPARAPAPVSPHHRVLVVDDNEDAAETLAELVRALGHEAEVVYDGAAAVRRAGVYHPDVVLCDIGLPVMDGYAVAHELRAAHGRDVRLVAISGYAQPDDVTRAAEAGFDEHVAKPCGPEQIERLLS